MKKRKLLPFLTMLLPLLIMAPTENIFAHSRHISNNAELCNILVMPHILLSALWRLT